MSESLREHPLALKRPVLRILIASPPVTARGPLPKHTPLLVDGLRSLGCRVITADWGSGPGQESTARRAVSRTRDLIGIWCKARKSSSDVVVVKTAHDWATLARDIPLMLGLCVIARTRVIQFHGSRPDILLDGRHRLFRVATRLLLATGSAVMVLSTEESDAWRRFRPKTRIYVVKNPFLAGQSVHEPVAVNAAPLVLFVGRLIAQKGVLDLVEAAGMLASSVPECLFKIVIAGDGPESSSILDRAQALGIEDRVTLVGYVDSEALRHLYSRATLLTLPTYHPEGFPTVIAEAMAAGLPIVTTAIRGAADYLENGVNALLISLKNPAQLAHAIRTLLEDPGLCRRMGQENMKKVALFAPERVAAEYLEVLLQIAARS